MILMCKILRKFDINSVYICPPHLYTVATLFWEIQKVIFQHTKNHQNRLIFDRVIRKIKRWTFLGDTV